ncbi:energy transducer TonB [Halosquirtibacter xylanolyticus]|uniref:energy transducer TonB n=1 Tax=Halosquirtibacter xylanolyticus TaxID=3374599 RepID=UPI003748C276|nr:energy transducer TonB [Prolixibacteraceae bacterium]
MRKLTILLTMMCLCTYISIAQSTTTTKEEPEIEEELMISDEVGQDKYYDGYMSDTFDYDDESPVFNFVDVNPIFCKGIAPEDSLQNFIKKNIKYPKNLTDSVDLEPVCVRFIVDKKGETGHHKVPDKLHPFLDKEAIRVARLIKYQTPAIYKGKPVKKAYRVYIEFE